MSDNINLNTIKSKKQSDNTQTKRDKAIKDSRKKLMIKSLFHSPEQYNPSILSNNPIINDNQSSKLIDQTSNSINPILEKFIQSCQKYCSSIQISQFLQQINENINDESQYFSYQFCKKISLIYPPDCEKCKNKMSEAKIQGYVEGRGWRCYVKGCKKNKAKLYKGNPIFDHFKLPLRILLKLFLQLIPCQSNNQQIKQQFSEVSRWHITKARMIWKEIVMLYYERQYQQTKLGENTAVVEVDECHFKRKFNKGRLLKNKNWIVGLTERTGGFESTLLFPVLKRDKSTLTNIISGFVSPSCVLLCTDAWKGYIGLSELGFNHQVVNHSKNFVVNNQNNENNNNSNQRNYKLNAGHLIHTQTIESRWMHLKSRLSLMKGQRKHFLSDVFVALFYLSFKDKIEQKSLQIIQDFIKIKLNNNAIQDSDDEQISLNDTMEEEIDDADEEEEAIALIDDSNGLMIDESKQKEEFSDDEISDGEIQIFENKLERKYSLKKYKQKYIY